MAGECCLDDGLRTILPEIEARAAVPFLVEQADPIDEMWALLWLQGVRDPLIGHPPGPAA
ncbi:MAG: hypothetical protein R2748_12885 [Bryobacterales bacterium]